MKLLMLKSSRFPKSKQQPTINTLYRFRFHNIQDSRQSWTNPGRWSCALLYQ